MRPTPRSSHSHTQPHRSKASTTPISPPPRVAASVGLAHAPIVGPSLRNSSPSRSGRAPSPNYFGLIKEPGTDTQDSGSGPKANWSPPTSSILSFGAVSPKHIPVDSNPEFEAFKRQSQSNTSFNLGHGNLSHFASTPGAGVVAPRTDSSKKERKSSTTKPEPQDLSPKSSPRILSSEPMEIELGRDSAYESSPSVRNLRASAASTTSFFDLPRQQSPANIASPHPPPRNVLSPIDDRHPRLSLPHNRADPPSPHQNLQPRSSHARANTLPAALEDGPSMITSTQLKNMLENISPEQILLLDLRVNPQYSVSRIKDALNLCIPTTLLKRPSFNLQKLKETFTNEAERERFSRWKESKCIVVYDSYSLEKKDAISAVNTLKKFSNEGWNGHCYILRGGFNTIAKEFPELVDGGTTQHSSKVSLSLGTSMSDVAPVAGGCVMPATKNAANPFFSNIRQNQDLIGGVGQMSLKVPEEFSADNKDNLPNWLQQASAKEDHGKRVAGKFLTLELDEQKRMIKALSSDVQYGPTAAADNNHDVQNVQIAGIEKGSKNRYNNIWPFEHARVRLQGRPEGACDYVNASHIKSTRSNKRYIASQGPLPATFEDFWSVIWDQDVRVIVMLTAEKEGGQLKCHPYWSSKDYGPLHLRTLSEKKVSLDLTKHRTTTDRRDSGQRRRANTTAETAPPPASSTETPHAVVRKFTLAHTAHPFAPIREITQIHYASWPDFGAPASPGQLLNLVELSNQMQRAASSSTASPRSSDPENDESARPILVHCSAGCGRTGTFCTIDTVIDMLKRQRKEVRSGVTPMEISSEGDYMGKGKNPKDGQIEGGWVFDQNVDLVERTVEDFRGQRLSMVQSLRQYVLCYETVMEWIARELVPARIGGRRGSDAGVARST
ncbi:phosphatase-like protein [Bisporella sp. PMI_857]|nr:phosphatase-like protein [Bisporella sp. PMI_857]